MKSHHITFSFISIYVGILALFIFFSGDAYSVEILDEAWSVALERRAVPIKLLEKNNTINYDSISMLKLMQRTLVFTFKKHSPEREIFYVLGVLCTLDDKSFISDAVTLEPGETASEFLKSNIKYVVFLDEDIRYERCARGGESAVTKQFSERADIWESERRVFTYLNQWAYFFAVYRDRPERAAEFFNVAIDIQTQELRKIMNSNKASELHYLVKYLDYSNPLALIRATNSLAGVDVRLLMQYLETIIYIRKKLLGFYPEHEESLNYEASLLEALRKK